MASLEDSVKSKAYILFDDVFQEAGKRGIPLPLYQSRAYHRIRRDFAEYAFRSSAAKKETEKSPLLKDYLKNLPEDLQKKLLSLRNSSK